MSLELIHGEALGVLSGMADESVQCCITSPPYWGLRDYGTAEWIGGDTDCDHRKPPNGSDPTKGSTLGGGKKTTGHSQESWGAGCNKCGATRVDRQIGLENTPEEYVARLVAVFREVKRVLRDDGTLWLNLGDSYNAGRDGGHAGGTKGASRPEVAPNRSGGNAPGLKPKDLVGIPWRVAFALQADGWYLRSDIIWAKPNPMPESVTDRPTKAHEYVFLLSKSQRYYYDADALREPAEKRDFRRDLKPSTPEPGQRMSQGSSWSQAPGASGFGHHDNGRNRRTVWTIPTQPFAAAHFAVMPKALVEPCVLAGAPEGGIVLDPFAGSGTVGVVCRKHKRDFIGIELNEEYSRMARGRFGENVTHDDAPLFDGLKA